MARRRRALCPAPSTDVPQRYARALIAAREAIRDLLLELDVDRRDLADVEQDVLLGAWSSLKAGFYEPPENARPEEAFWSWLRGIAWRQVSHHHESAWARRARVVANPLALTREVVPSPDESEEAFRVRDALQSMPDPSARLLIRRYLLGDTSEEIARDARVSPRRVMQRIQHARWEFSTSHRRGRKR